MAVTLSAAYLAKLKEGSNIPVTIIEIELDSGVRKFSDSMAGFSDVQAVIGTPSSTTNKLDTKKGYSTRGNITFVIKGREHFRDLIENNYLKNRRVTRKDGFEGLAYADYAATFTGIILDWKRKEDTLTITVADEAIKTTKKIPVANATKTQYLDFRNMNPIDIMKVIFLTELGIDAARIDVAQFDLERDTWLSKSVFDRVLTSSKESSKYLNELQIETNSFIIHDGEKITHKVFSPPIPGQFPDLWTDKFHILDKSLTANSGYKDEFYNQVEVNFNYDESGSDKEENFESRIIVVEVDSQSSAQWDEVKIKTINSKWIRSHTYTLPINITGVVIYHMTANNGIGSGTLTFDQAANTLTWAAPNGTAGEGVKLSKNGKFQIFDVDKTKYVRVIAETASLPGSNQSDTITITALDGEVFATRLAKQRLRRYSNPVPSIEFSVDMNLVAYKANSEFLKPTDLVDITTDDAAQYGSPTFVKERMMITRFTPDRKTGKAKVNAIHTGMVNRYGFIAPAGYPDYASATDEQREYVFIGRASDNKVYDGAAYVDGYYIW